MSIEFSSKIMTSSGTFHVLFVYDINEIDEEYIFKSFLSGEIDSNIDIYMYLTPHDIEYNFNKISEVERQFSKYGITVRQMPISQIK